MKDFNCDGNCENCKYRIMMEYFKVILLVVFILIAIYKAFS